MPRLLWSLSGLLSTVLQPCDRAAVMLHDFLLSVVCCCYAWQQQLAKGHCKFLACFPLGICIGSQLREHCPLDCYLAVGHVLKRPKMDLQSLCANVITLGVLCHMWELTHCKRPA